MLYRGRNVQPDQNIMTFRRMDLCHHFKARPYKQDLVFYALWDLVPFGVDILSPFRLLERKQPKYSLQSLCLHCVYLRFL